MAHPTQEYAMLNYKALATTAACICFSLALAWMFAPDMLLGLWGAAYAPAAGFVARRMSGLFLALAILFFKTRHSEPSPVRCALMSSFTVGCSVIAALGVFELARGQAGPGILSAVLVEIALAAAFATLASREQTGR